MAAFTEHNEACSRQCAQPANDAFELIGSTKSLAEMCPIISGVCLDIAVSVLPRVCEKRRCASAATARHRPLHRRTFDRTVGTKDATVAYPRPQLGVAAGTLVQDDTRVGWHAFDRSEAADRTDEGGLKNR